MLTLLRISGFALIDELELPLGPGLTAVTGETGAGKSILVDALGLLRGGRAGADVIRTGRDEARVEAILELPPGSAKRGRPVGEGREGVRGLFLPPPPVPVAPVHAQLVVVGQVVGGGDERDHDHSRSR